MTTQNQTDSTIKKTRLALSQLLTPTDLEKLIRI